MPTVLDCPACQRKLRVTDDLVGHLVRCPTCGDTFTVSPPISKAPLIDSPPQEPVQAPVGLDRDKPDDFNFEEADEKPARPRRRTRPGATREFDCPRCGETVSARAAHCRFCGEQFIEGDEESDEEDDVPSCRRRPRRDWEPHRGTIVLVLGILSIVIPIIGLFLGIAAWVMGSTDLRKMNRREMDPEGKGVSQAGWICGIIGTIWQCVISLFCIGYFVLIAYVIRSAGAGGFAPPTKGTATIQKPQVPKNLKPGQQPPGFNNRMDNEDDDDDK